MASSSAARGAVSVSEWAGLLTTEPDIGGVYGFVLRGGGTATMVRREPKSFLFQTDKGQRQTSDPEEWPLEEGSLVWSSSWGVEAGAKMRSEKVIVSPGSDYLRCFWDARAGWLSLFCERPS